MTYRMEPQPRDRPDGAHGSERGPRVGTRGAGHAARSEERLATNPTARSTDALDQEPGAVQRRRGSGAPLDTITRRAAKKHFHIVSQRRGWAVANHIVALLRQGWRRACLDHQTLRNLVDV